MLAKYTAWLTMIKVMQWPWAIGITAFTHVIDEEDDKSTTYIHLP